MINNCLFYDGPGGPSYTTFRDADSGPKFLKALSNYTVRVGSDVTFTCQVENVTNYKVKIRDYLG